VGGLLLAALVLVLVALFGRLPNHESQITNHESGIKHR
jgi:hypothetical protein